MKEDASYMADNDDKREDSGAGGKKTLSLKGGPSVGARPNVARSSRNTVVVEKRTRFVPPGSPGAHTPHTPHTPRPPQGGGGAAPA